MRGGVRGARRDVKINKFGEDRVQVARALERQRVKDALRVHVMCRIMMNFANMSNLGGFAVFALIAQAGRRCHKIAKVGMERVIGKGNKYIRAQTGCWVGARGKSVAYNRCSIPEGII